MKHGSLFSGIGGFDLAAEWMGWDNVFHCEINDFGQKILNHYWPHATSYTDITKTDFTIHRGKIDIVTGGFPCQPFSAAGKRKGNQDDRHLWPEMLRAIREIQPRWVVGENVLGLLNWSRGLVFHQVQTDLEAAGYIIFPYVLPACAKNAPHRRDRTWIVAHSDVSEQRNNNRTNNGKEKDIWGQNKGDVLTEFRGNGNVANTNGSIRRKGRLHTPKFKTAERHISSFNARGNEWNTWHKFPTQSPLCSRDDGLSPGLAGITVSKHRTESIKGYGNSIVPQIAFEIFKAIEQYDRI